jgi:oligopeptide transport system substrate-binding protein
MHVKLSKRNSALVASSITAAMMLSACGSNDEPGGDGAIEGGGGGSFSMEVGEPENPLVPGNTTESEGAQIVDALWTGLVEYETDGSASFTGVAESIESEDNQTWTVTLKDGWTFHDGSPVTANSFVDAWNYTAYSPNAQGGSYFMSHIEGYKDLQAETDDAGNVVAEPAGKEMIGLEVVDDLTFEVTLDAPFSQFPLVVGYTAFYPMPESFFEDPEAAAQDTPVGNGPFMAEGPLEPGVGIDLVRYEDYAGENAAQADAVEMRIYQDLNTSYTDVQGGNLDITAKLPPDAITTAPTEFGDRYIEAPSSSFTYMGFPTYDPRFADPKVRQGISLAIDREAITEAIFDGSRKPADSYISPVVDGYREGICEFCAVDVERANQLLDEAGFDRNQPVELWFNAGAGHDAWVEAVGNQLRENLGIEYVLRGDLDFAEYLPLIDSKGMTGPFRLGWAMDYPSPQNYLEPLYSSAALPPAGSNATFYTNAEFDELIAQGNQADTNEEAVELYQQAEDILLRDMPIAPMFYGLEQGVHSENVSNVIIDIFGHVDLAAVTVNG